MSESTSSPYVHLHPISPSSSLSSTDSAPRSEPTSDEQPDLGAFTTVLREWTHLQPPPRIPVQIRSATSSTTPTFQPEQSVVGSDFYSRSGRSRNSRLSTRSGMSVWNHAPIALYLNSGTPSNDVISEDEEEYESREDGEYTPSAPNSPASTSLTVEIASEIDFPSFDGSQDSNRILLDSSPFPYHTDPGIAVAVPLESNSQRLDSRETGHTEDGLRPPSSEGHGDHSSRTSRDFVRPGVTGGSYSVPSSQSQVHSHDHSQTGSSITSVQLQSQARAPTTTAMSSSDSLALPVPVSTIITSATREVPSSTQVLHSGNDATSVNSSTSTSTLINALLTRTWDPQPPRTTSDSSFMTGSASSSNLSLLSYQIPETPPITVDEDSDRDQGPSSAFSSLRPQPPRPQLPTNQFSSSSTSLPSTSSNSGSLSLKTQRSLLSANSSSHSTTTLTARRQPPLSRPFHSSSIPQAPSLASNGSPLPNPYSPLPVHESDRPTNVGVEVRSSLGDSRGYITIRDFGVVDDIGTPDQPPSETLLFDPPRGMRAEFLPIDDDEDEEMRIESKPAPALPRFRRSDASLHKAQPSQTSVYNSGYDRPGPSGHRQPLSHRQLVAERTIHLEPQYDDDDDDYPYQYPYSHTPRSHAQAATPRGIPPRPEPSAPTSATQAEFPSQHRQVELSGQPFSQMQPQTHNTLVQRDVDTQQISRPPMEPQPQSQIYPPTKINMQTQTVAPPPATQTQPQLSPKYPFGYAPAESSTTRLHASTQSTSFTQTQELASEGHGYRHSLLGLHALPASLVSPEPDDFPEFKPAVEPVTPLTAQPQLLVETDSTRDITRLEEVSKQELPSLGYLDEALSFIAAERARWSAARPSTSWTSGPSDSREIGDEAGSGEEGEGQEGEGEAEWKQVNVERYYHRQ
ncbi:hypothetical protein GALMADRAFT_891423 [Galerina marginata CBS 339.88]|uniref:Uncharacterized protein n=1 Tax=Galerina marginata (strain CBS 339.88) TaxID=685588 RepID=A0A067SGW9_GALM3|nr:hypothetical protein GALMADRAFT_891423 [Galerina marginata CBS 339.88]